MFPQILEGEERMSYESLRPIEEYAAGGGTNDISRIHI
jgi:hypothetical protein